MSIPFAIVAGLTIVSAIAAMSLRHLVHCALALTATFAGLAALYLQLNAEFVGFAQILVYVGAVAILIVFAILLTRSSDIVTRASVVSGTWWIGLGVALLAFGSLAAAVLSSAVVKQPAPPPPETTVKMIGSQLLANYVLPLEVIGLLLTAAMIGAIIVAMQDGKGNKAQP